MTLQRIDYTWRGKPMHRYEIDGARVTGVTTVLSQGIPKGAIAPWAARTVAEYTCDNLTQIVDMLDSGGRNPTVDYLKGIPWQQRDDAAVRGTDVHTLGERLVHGLEVDVPEHLYGYVDGYARWLDEAQVEPLLTEFVVGSSEHGYAGTADLILLDGRGMRRIADIKTSRGVYGEAALQLAAYRFAEFYLGTNGIESAIPSVDDIGWVLHVQDGLTEARPVPVDRAQFGVFLAAMQVAGWAKNSRDLVGPPVRFATQGDAA